MINRRLLEELALEWNDGKALLRLDDAELAYELLLRVTQYAKNVVQKNHKKASGLRKLVHGKRIEPEILAQGKKIYETGIAAGKQKKAAEIDVLHATKMKISTIRKYRKQGWKYK